MPDTARAFVAGHPIGHSRSPLIHRHWLEIHGLHGIYEAIDISPDNFTSFIGKIVSQGWRGGNVTIPHKEAAFAAIEHSDDAAKAIGAVNTIWSAGTDLHASNTDAFGFAANLDDHAPQWRQGESALIIGAGGASRAVVFALREAGFDRIAVANRTIERAQNLATRFGPQVHALPMDAVADELPSADLIVNTTALGMKGQPPLDLDLDRASDDAIAADIVYTPIMTPFLHTAQRRGLVFVDGLGMLLHQAQPGFERWFGVRPDVTEELRTLVLDDLKKAKLA